MTIKKQHAVVIKLMKRIKRDIDEIKSNGWEIHAMDDTLLALDPVGVKIVGHERLPDSLITENMEHLYDICMIDDSGEW